MVSRDQLLGLGLGRGAIDYWVSSGRLHPRYRGVYAVGRRIVSQHGRWMAAVLACGPHAVLSHQSAAALWNIRGTTKSRIDVTGMFRLNGCHVSPSSNDMLTARSLPATRSPRRDGSSRTT